ncbi:MAG: UDP-glucose--hexose-1-phosphate uridylyltransferase [Gammaproteobacteria bacterium]|nr:UDP-glucose--hexose-1-phosphate uridylyltransferase [Gammaproteobacteria bacterium]
MAPPPAVQHRRFNPLTGRWVLVSPHRAQRPWLGQVEDAQAAERLPHDPSCHLCPGGMRAGGQRNPDYRGPFVFPNDFPALQDLPPEPGIAADAVLADADPLFTAEPVRGECRVICWSHDHSLTLAGLTQDGLCAVVDCWAAQSAELGARHPWVQVFENKGAMMGCSNPHPHGQIWASGHLPEEAALEDRHQRDHLARHGRPLLLELAAREAGGPREVLASGRWLAIVPWWAAWPFETLLLPRVPVQRFDDLDGPLRDELATMLGRLARSYDSLFGCSFPYSMGWHGAPYLPGDAAHWQLHAHFYPPLLRSATVRKFMVGYEMLAEPQRDLTPEAAAARLRAVAAA